jgi:hypothetical protein
MNISSALYEYFDQTGNLRRPISQPGKAKENGAKSGSIDYGAEQVFEPRPAFPPALRSELDRSPLKSAGRPVRMGLFHFSNNNLSIRRKCARDVGMYDPAVRAEDVDLCFRIALTTDWIPCREKGMVVRHKGRRTMGALLRQMWGYGYKVGYPYSKTRVRGAYLYFLDGLNRKLLWKAELTKLPFLVCVFASEFYILQAALVLSLLGLLSGRLWLAFGGLAVGTWAARRYILDLDRGDLSVANYVKLTLLRYLTDCTYIVGGIIGGLRHGVILLPCPVFPSRRARNSKGEQDSAEREDLGMMRPGEESHANVG